MINPGIARLDIRTLRAIPVGIWALGFVPMLMDISSEMIHALLPVYLVTVLGTSALTVGVIEGGAEATAAITKVFSEALSDWLGNRKLLAAIGYGLAAGTKPIFPLATGVGWLVAARFIDRIGKYIRGAPRDALVADLSPLELRGASFSGVFLILRAQSEGLALALVPNVLVLMNVFYALSSYPAGELSDNRSRANVLAFGLLLLIAADLVMALTPRLVGRRSGCRAVGIAHEILARPAVGAHRRYGRARTSRHSIWYAQPCDGCGPTRGKYHRRYALGRGRTPSDVPRRSRVRGCRVHRTGSVARMLGDVSDELNSGFSHFCVGSFTSPLKKGDGDCAEFADIGGRGLPEP